MTHVEGAHATTLAIPRPARSERFPDPLGVDPASRCDIPGETDYCTCRASRRRRAAMA